MHEDSSTVDWVKLGPILEAAGVSKEEAIEILSRGGLVDDLVAAAMGHGAPIDGGLKLLKDIQCRDAEDVAAGRRAARSLWAVQKGDLEGFTFTPNSNSEFDRPGEGW
ncbi:UNVERIFIED_ORG: hypothetical protein LHJ69_23745 (plasmid) [Shinella sp. XGS7]|nr:hypothetical protein [Shinella sp. XGS7]